MKRIAVLVLVGLLVAATGAFALKSTPDFAIGGEVTDVNFNTLGVMMNLHFKGVPLYFAVGANLLGTYTGGIELAATLDFWLLHNPISTGYVSWYLGLGLTGAFGFNPAGYGLGLRVPVGLQIWPANNETLEVFLEVAPAWVPLGGAGFSPLNFQAQIALGMRFWLEG